MTKIVAAAIMRNGEIITGKRHWTCIHEAVLERGWEKPVCVTEQGFVDEDGNYYTREQARKIVTESGQLNKPLINNAVLLSEDLW